MKGRNRIDLKQYRTSQFLRWVIWQFDLRSNLGGTLFKRGPCPICSSHHRASRNLAVDIPNGVWYCHGCNLGGDSITLYSRLAKVTCWEAAVELSQLAGSPVPWLDSPSPLVAAEGKIEKSTAPNHAVRNNQYIDSLPPQQPDHVSAVERICGSDSQRN